MPNWLRTGNERAQNPIFGDEVLILKPEFLIDQPGDVGQRPSLCCLA
jgi:hypothetical protein